MWGERGTKEKEEIKQTQKYMIVKRPPIGRIMNELVIRNAPPASPVCEGERDILKGELYM